MSLPCLHYFLLNDEDDYQRMLSHNSTIFLPAFASISSGKARVVILPRRELLLLHHLTVIHLSVSSLPSPPLLFSSVQVHIIVEVKNEQNHFFLKPLHSAQLHLKLSGVVPWVLVGDYSQSVSTIQRLLPTVPASHFDEGPTTYFKQWGNSTTFDARPTSHFQAARQLRHL